jgi:hypothetical protein
MREGLEEGPRGRERVVLVNRATRHRRRLRGEYMMGSEQGTVELQERRLERERELILMLLQRGRKLEE